jgi:hypothetical protein
MLTLMEWQTFLSYSRNDYQAAEFMALGLQKRGVRLWFDVQQLEPGTDWQQDIHSGLEQSGSVLLLASRSALDSPYVEREWRHALDASRPVIIARLDRVRLPRELRGMPQVDCRQNAATSIEHVANAINDPDAPIPGQNWLFRPLPSIIRRAALGLLLTDAANIGRALLFGVLWQVLFSHANAVRWLLELATDFVYKEFRVPVPLTGITEVAYAGGILVSLLLIIGSAPLIRLLLLLRHHIGVIRAIPGRMYSGALLFWTGILACGLLPPVAEQQAQSGFSPPELPTIALSLAVILILWWVGRLGRRLMHVPDSAALKEWSRFGSRSWVGTYGTSLPPSYRKPALISALRFQIVSTNYDEPTMPTIERIVADSGGDVVARGMPANYTIVLLNHAASRSQIANALNGEAPVLGIITSPFVLPRTLEKIKRLQLVDFSHGDGERLLANLRLLTANTDVLRSELQTWLGPVNLKRITPPREIIQLLTPLLALLLLSAGGLAVSLAAGFGDSIYPVAFSGIGCVLLLIPLLRLQRGHTISRILLILLVWAAIVASSAALALIPDGTQIGAVLIWDALFTKTIVGIALLTGLVLLWQVPRTHLHHVTTTDALGMPPVPLPLRPALVWVGGLLALIIVANLRGHT